MVVSQSHGAGPFRRKTAHLAMAERPHGCGLPRRCSLVSAKRVCRSTQCSQRLRAQVALRCLRQAKQRSERRRLARPGAGAPGREGCDSLRCLAAQEPSPRRAATATAFLATIQDGEALEVSPGKGGFRRGTAEGIKDSSLRVRASSTVCRRQPWQRGQSWRFLQA